MKGNDVDEIRDENEDEGGNGDNINIEKGGCVGDFFTVCCCPACAHIQQYKEVIINILMFTLLHNHHHHKRLVMTKDLFD